MTKEVYEGIKAGLEDALAYVKGDTSRGTAHTVMVPVVDVRAVRGRLGMSQAAFARRFGVSAATVRNWEQGRRLPDGPGLALLRIAARHPRIIRENLESAA